LFARPRQDGDDPLVRIGPKADASPVARHRLRRFLFPICIAVVVLGAVGILIRASFDTDEPTPGGLARRAGSRPTVSTWLASPNTGAAPTSRESPVRAAAAPAPRPVAEPSDTAAGAVATGGSGPAGAPVPAAPLGPATAAGSDEARGSPGDASAVSAPGPRSPAHAGSALAAGKDALRASGAVRRPGTPGSAAKPPAGPVPGPASETKLAVAADASKRDAVWGRSPSAEDSSSKLVASFAPSGGATLKGRVIDAESGRPSAGVAIEAHIGDAFMRTVSDGAGIFKMSGMLPGRKITVWIIGRSDTFVAERIDVTSPGEGETADAGVVRLLRGDELAAHLEGWMGVFVSRRGRRNVVAAVSPWSPADRAGIQVGDLLLSIEGRDVDGLGPRATGFLLRGPVGTKANIAVQSRDGAVHRYQLERVLR
jgi:hypothetical protein